MSMINDALRRASSGAAVAPPPLPPQPAMAPAPVLPPPLPGQLGSESEEPLNEAPSAAPRTSSLAILLLALFLFCLAGAAAVYLWQRNHRPALPKENQPGQTLASAAPAAPAPKPVVPEARPTAAPAAVTAPAKAPQPAVQAAPAAPFTPMRVDFPPLRLQGIYYRSENPSVMINNRSLYVNDQVQGVTVAAIGRSSVTLVLSGHTNILTLR